MAERVTPARATSAARRLARALGAALVGLVCAAPLVPSGGCINLCPSIDRFYTRGEALTAPNGAAVYETSPIDGPFMPFEGGTNWHIPHHLGRVPTSVAVTLAFQERPLVSGGYSQAAGNQAVVLSANERDVVVRNDTCSDFFVRVVVTADAPIDAGAEAGAEAGADAADEAAADAPDGG